MSRGLTVLQVQQTRLANVLQFGTRLADFRLFKAHASSRLPSKHREWSSADLTALPKVSANAKHRGAEEEFPLRYSRAQLIPTCPYLSLVMRT